MAESEAVETTPEVAAATKSEPFRFFDNREKYLLFVMTTSEKAEVAARIGREIGHIVPRPPALRLFDAGTGNGMVLSQVLRELHRRLPTVPFFVVGKEVSMEDTRLTLATLPDRLAEHPQSIVVLTNMFYAEAPTLFPRSPVFHGKVRWIDVALKGNTSHEFFQQIHELDDHLAQGWQTASSPKTGNPVYVTPSVMVLYREDHAFALDDLIPRPTGGPQPYQYDLVLAAQPYRSRTSAETKVKNVLAPLAKALAPSGRLVVVQSTGHDPGMEIIRRIWPAEDPFATPRHSLIKELDAQLNDDIIPKFGFEGTSDAASLFTYHLHAMPNEVSNRISTSTTMAAWNAAVYVAQIEDERTADVLMEGKYLEATADGVLKHGGLWFQDESFVVVRHAP
jgi:nicotinamidase-related amidase